MADVLGTGPQRMRVGGLARRFRATGSQADLDNLKQGIAYFEMTVEQDREMAEKAAIDQAAAAVQQELPDGHIGTTEGDSTETA